MVTAISDQFLGSAETPVRPLNFERLQTQRRCRERKITELKISFDRKKKLYGEKNSLNVITFRCKLKFLVCHYMLFFNFLTALSFNTGVTCNFERFLDSSLLPSWSADPGTVSEELSKVLAFVNASRQKCCTLEYIAKQFACHFTVPLFSLHCVTNCSVLGSATPDNTGQASFSLCSGRQQQFLFSCLVQSCFWCFSLVHSNCSPSSCCVASCVLLFCIGCPADSYIKRLLPLPSIFVISEIGHNLHKVTACSKKN